MKANRSIPVLVRVDDARARCERARGHGARILMEPTDFEYGERRYQAEDPGLGAAVSLACLRAMRSAGATRAVVCPRGDPAYPVPRRLYHRIGFRDEGRTVTYAH